MYLEYSWGNHTHTHLCLTFLPIISNTLNFHFLFWILLEAMCISVLVNESHALHAFVIILFLFFSPPGWENTFIDFNKMDRFGWKREFTINRLIRRKCYSVKMTKRNCVSNVKRFIIFSTFPISWQIFKIKMVSYLLIAGSIKYIANSIKTRLLIGSKNLRSCIHGEFLAFD